MEATRFDGRLHDQVRQISITYDAFGYADASLLFCLGQTKVLVSVSLKQGVPQFLKGSGKGWLTAEYAMLPCATIDRTQRETQQNQRNSRSVEISRIIGRCLRSVVNLDCIGERTIMIDCDVLQADGGTRVACITAASRALELAHKRWVSAGIIPEPFLKTPIAAISVGFIDGVSCVDLAYDEDSHAQSDFNFVMTQTGSIIEIQGTAETTPLAQEQFDKLKDCATRAIKDLFEACFVYQLPEQSPKKIQHHTFIPSRSQQTKVHDRKISDQASKPKGNFFSLAQRVSK